MSTKIHVFSTSVEEDATLAALPFTPEEEVEYFARKKRVGDLSKPLESLQTRFPSKFSGVEVAASSCSVWTGMVVTPDVERANKALQGLHVGPQAKTLVFVEIEAKGLSFVTDPSKLDAVAATAEDEKKTTVEKKSAQDLEKERDEADGMVSCPFAPDLWVPQGDLAALCEKFYGDCSLLVAESSISTYTLREGRDIRRLRDTDRTAQSSSSPLNSAPSTQPATGNRVTRPFAQAPVVAKKVNPGPAPANNAGNRAQPPKRLRDEEPFPAAVGPPSHQLPLGPSGRGPVGPRGPRPPAHVVRFAHHRGPMPRVLPQAGIFQAMASKFGHVHEVTVLGLQSIWVEMDTERCAREMIYQMGGHVTIGDAVFELSYAGDERRITGQLVELRPSKHSTSIYGFIRPTGGGPDFFLPGWRALRTATDYPPATGTQILLHARNEIVELKQDPQEGVRPQERRLAALDVSLPGGRPFTINTYDLSKQLPVPRM